MPLLLLIALVLVGIALWSSRLRAGDRPTDTVIDAADRFRARQGRRLPAGERGIACIAAITDPVTAAATYVRLIVGPEVWPMAQGRLQVKLAEVSSFPMAAEAIGYADRAAGETFDERQAIGLLTDMLRDRLTLEERQDLARMLADAAQSGPRALQARASREALALVN